jgi:transposase-like protein
MRDTEGAAKQNPHVACDVEGAGDVAMAETPRPRPARQSSTLLARGGGPSSDEVVSLLPDGFWSLLRSWLRPHRGLSQEKLPLYLGFFQFVHNARRQGKALLGSLIEALVA